MNSFLCIPPKAIISEDFFVLSFQLRPTNIRRWCPSFVSHLSGASFKYSLISSWSRCSRHSNSLKLFILPGDSFSCVHSISILYGGLSSCIFNFIPYGGHSRSSLDFNSSRWFVLFLHSVSISYGGSLKSSFPVLSYQSILFILILPVVHEDFRVRDIFLFNHFNGNK